MWVQFSTHGKLHIAAITWDQAKETTWERHFSSSQGLLIAAYLTSSQFLQLSVVDIPCDWHLLIWSFGFLLTSLLITLWEAVHRDSDPATLCLLSQAFFWNNVNSISSGTLHDTLTLKSCNPAESASCDWCQDLKSCQAKPPGDHSYSNLSVPR